VPDSPDVSGERIVVTPLEDSELVVNGRTYAGEIEIASAGAGLAVVEETTIDRYLYGIAEVPFSWPDEALRAQAIAARTYLAWTLDRGRSTNGRRFGYDICATDQCQVYGGLSQVEGDGGDRWASAVRTTAEQVLLSRGRPAQTLYSSTAGTRTRSVEDVFDASPVSYLTAVPSPGESSPFVDWTVELSGAQMSRILREAGLATGAVRDVSVETTRDGAGPWIVTVEENFSDKFTLFEGIGTYEVVDEGGVVKIATYDWSGVITPLDPQWGG